MQEIKAIEKYGTPYMTHADNNEEKRAFCTRLRCTKFDETRWRGATAEEREEWLKEREKAQNQTQ